ncbi:hypothetical protein Calle1_38 [Cellulophaga phage Calle_1]|uniref:Uncharacterized protein n=1 Tax=Cellulophaga phage Calle_1 TaxID=2745643 RepID=A0A8E4ZBG9_9CAUD|nr:hypothetical protein M1M22_gp077 [Cellulophaga phage Calle_1]QQV89692.1 hypothetical protein Calle1_38 [Cellulophaga phage Calle_1]QQV89812.1 hypothetical protein Calle2_38 [Cellulophaga phage Calle_2]QQV89907.1 hypothetical protein Calle3_38 [Cellulophaga phage Calle_3]
MLKVKAEIGRSKEDMIKLLNETAQYYSEDLSRRGTKSGPISGCVYKSDKGSMCAVGRCMVDEAPFEEFNLQGSIGSLAILNGVNPRTKEGAERVDAFLKDEYKGYPVSFWECLQEFHDGEQYWVVGADGDENGSMENVLERRLLKIRAIKNNILFGKYKIQS